MERLRLSPSSYHRITLAALVGLAFIVVTGAAVRLTGSGLGCPDWPTCSGGRIVAPAEYHARIEFLNRTITGLVSVAVMLAVLGSLARRPRRRDLTWLSLGLVAGVLAQIVLGGLVVLFHLAPPLVMGHFLVSMLLLLDATVLHHRAGQPDGVARAVVSPAHLVLGKLTVAAAALAIFLGTVVTGSGPHAGSHEGQLVERLPFAVADVARLHGAAVVLFGAVVLYLVRSLRVAGAPPDVLRRAQVLLGVLVAQAAVGYSQYFTGVPPLLVAVHVAGAVAVWVATLRVVLGMHVRVQPSPASASFATIPV
ncbi:MAG: COX15/CtaA family protein [Actinobacteria bacterium]|nr:COX15/CtaA family protein [Actinomycetota bacterium]MBW3650682.1 COX15/CtaA family protein [Actinomycetota bacterium]